MQETTPQVDIENVSVNFRVTKCEFELGSKGTYGRVELQPGLRLAESMTEVATCLFSSTDFDGAFCGIAAI